MSYEPSPYINQSALARPARRKRKAVDVGLFSGTNDKDVQRDGHVFPPPAKSRPQASRPLCRRCGQSMFIVFGLPCAGRKL